MGIICVAIIACWRNSHLPKIITSRHRESETGRARLYIKSRLMLPTIPLAMVTLLTGYGSLAFMWFQDTLTLQALLASTALFVVGAIFGWAHVCYERYLVRTCPEYLARKHKLLEAAKDYKRPKRDLARAVCGSAITIAALARRDSRQMKGTTSWLPIRRAEAETRCSGRMPGRLSALPNRKSRSADYIPHP